SNVSGWLFRFKPVDDVQDPNTTLGDGGLTTVQPRINNDANICVLGELDTSGPAVLIRNAGQIITDNRPEYLLAAANDDQSLDNVLVRGITRLPAKVPQHFGTIGLQPLACKRLR